MKLTRPSRAVMLGGVAAMVVLAVWYQFFWTPQSATLAAAHKKALAASSGLISSEQRLGHLKKLSAKSVALDTATAKLVGAIPDHDAVDGFLIDLNNYAQSAGVLISTTAIAQPTASTTGSSSSTSADLTGIPLQLSVSGAYFDVEHFLDMLRDGQRLVVIDSVALSAGRSNSAVGSVRGNSTAVTGSIAARLFMVKGAVPPGANPPPTPVSTGTGVLETPINAARSTANSASASAASTASAAASAGGTP